MEEENMERMAQELALEAGITTPMGLIYLRQAIRNAQLFDRKQRDYGSGNIAVFGERGVIVRASDKVQRLKHMVFERAAAPENEAIADSWDDLANYGVIGRLCHDGRWG